MRVRAIAPMLVVLALPHGAEGVLGQSNQEAANAGVQAIAANSPGAIDADTLTVAGSGSEREETRDTDLIYSVNRTPEPPFATARAVEVITSEDIWRKNARTLPEVLIEEAGIFVQETNYGGGSPIIRGLMGKQILILVDGVKLNNATFRFGSLQYLATIDLDMVERIEIVRGVGSVLGSDALGGTINIITKKGPPGPEDRPIGGASFARYSSADRASTGHGEVFGRGPRWRYFAGVTQRNSGDVDGGGGLGRQRWTGYSEKAANFHFEHDVADERTLSLAYQVLEQNAVPRTDKMTDGTDLRFQFDPQRLQLARLSYQDLVARRWSDFVQVTTYWNRQDENRQEIRSSKPGVERHLSDGVNMAGVNFEAGASLGESHRLVYGIDYETESIRSARSDIDLATGISTAKRGTYTDGASYSTNALYIQDRFDLGRWLTPTLGLRYGRYAAGGSEISSVGPLDLKSSDCGVTGTVNLMMHPRPHLNLIASATRGYRAPNIDDISVFDERKEGIEVPNRNLQPERILTYQGGMKYSSRRVAAGAFYHYSYLTDLLVRSPGTFNGLPFFDPDGDGVQDPSEANVLQKHNTGKATIHGLEFDWRFQVPARLTVFGNATWTVGDDDLAHEPLSKIPPPFGVLGVRWSLPAGRAPWAEVTYDFAAAQRRLSAADEADSRVGPDGTPRFDVVNLRGGLSLARKLRAVLGVENLFDAEYKYHGSGVYRPGRQLVAGIQLGPER